MHRRDAESSALATARRVSLSPTASPAPRMPARALERHHARVSPYPQRNRTPPVVLSPTRSSSRASLNERDANPPAAQAQAGVTLFELTVRPFVKKTISEREPSSTELPEITVGGSSFEEIIRGLWERFKEHVQGRAVKIEDQWTKEEATFAHWQKVMQFRVGKHTVEFRDEDAWCRWLVRSRNGTDIKFCIYKYGVRLVKAKDHDEFYAQCILPAITDRAGATAEESLQDVVSQLEDHWGLSRTLMTLNTRSRFAWSSCVGANDCRGRRWNHIGSLTSTRWLFI